MTTLSLIIIIIVLIILLRKKSEGAADTDAYQRGYSDGWNALGSRVTSLLKANTLDKNKLKSLVDGQLDSVDSSELQSGVQAAHKSSKKQVVDSQQRALRNTNIVLYLASFLFVAAGAAFIAAAVDDTVKLFGVWLLVAAFYGAGLYIHANIPRLRPAAVAFAGTGMALLPFAGVALHRFGGVGSEAAWLLTSLVGLVAYYWVAVRLNSIVVSYLTMAFVLSLVGSSVAIASLPIVWGFMSIIGVSLAASLVSYVRPSWLPAVFNQPVERTGQIVTPVVLVASLFAPYVQQAG